jgi:competence/damage-inducible protein CinA C-terminal domain
MFEAGDLQLATEVLDRCRQRGVRVATAESCTGGLIGGLLTAIPGSSDVVDGGFITYSNVAKTEALGVPADLLSRLGAVHEAVARAMAEGVLAKSQAQLVVAVTGIAGPGGGSPGRPVGLVHLASLLRGCESVSEVHTFAGNRDDVRLQTVRAACRLLLRTLAQSAAP